MARLSSTLHATRSTLPSRRRAPPPTPLASTLERCTVSIQKDWIDTEGLAVVKPTLQTVADAVGVSRSTVSNAYGRPDQLSPELREKILEAARQLGYSG